MNNILFPDNKGKDGKDNGGFKIPKGPQMEPRVIMIKGEPGVGKTFFCTQLLQHFIQHLQKVNKSKGDDAFIRYVLTNDSNGGIKTILKDVFEWEENLESELIPDKKDDLWYVKRAEVENESTTDQTVSNKGNNPQKIAPFIAVENKKDDWYPALFNTLVMVVTFFLKPPCTQLFLMSIFISV